MLGKAFNQAKGALHTAQTKAIGATDWMSQKSHNALDKTGAGADRIEKLTRDHDLPTVEIKNSFDSGIKFIGEELDAFPGTAVRFSIGRIRNALKATGIVLDTVTAPIGKILRPIHTLTYPLHSPIQTITGPIKWALRPFVGAAEIARSITTDTLQSGNQIYERGIVRASQHLNKIVGDTRHVIETILSPIQWADAKFA